MGVHSVRSTMLLGGVLGIRGCRVTRPIGVIHKTKDSEATRAIRVGVTVIMIQNFHEHVESLTGA